MTMRASRANLSPKGTTHAPAKAAPKAPSKPASKAVKPTSKQLTKPTPPSSTKAHQAAATRTPNATAQAPRKAQRGLHIPSEADAPTQEELRAALARENQVPATGPYALDAAQMAAAAQVAAAHTATLIAVKRMSSADRRYAKGRIEDMIHAKNIEFKREREELNRWGMVRELFTKALASGRFSVDMAKVVRASTDTNVIDVVTLDDYPQGLGKHVQSLHDALDVRQANMKLEGARLLDEIMLGSPADAIVQIQRFESTKF
jgi:hypothetical protein